MFRGVFRPGGLVLVAVLLVPAAGCGPKGTTVTGVVTYENEPVASGYIAFLPADGQGAEIGGRITQGRYKVDNVLPGRKVVQIVSGDPGRPARSGGAPEPGKAAPVEARPPEGLVPPNAVGNNQVVEVGTKPQKLSFDLQKPKHEKKEEPPRQAPANPSPPPGGAGAPK
jgi:hypothetical protein